MDGCGINVGIGIVSAAVSVKMSALLMLPGMMVVMFRKRGLGYVVRMLFTMAAIQVVVAQEFLREDWRAYVAGAFDFSRVFMFQWTVNWRMVGEEMFLSKGWARGLLVGHLGVLVVFGLTRWTGGIREIERGLRNPGKPSSMKRMMTADGMCFVI